MTKTQLFYTCAFAVFAGVALPGCGDAGDDGATTAATTTPATSNVQLDDKAPAVTFKPADEGMVTHKPRGPISISYRIVGKPVVGQPLAVDLQVTSAFGPQPLDVTYRINDASAMRLTDAQPRKVTLSPLKNEPFMTEQVSIVPQREGRLYLNVAASVPTANGTMSTVTAIPIQVGEGPRALTENGALGTDEEGNAIRVLPGSE